MIYINVQNDMEKQLRIHTCQALQKTQKESINFNIVIGLHWWWDFVGLEPTG